MSRREAVLSAGLVFVVALVVRVVAASLDRLPEARGHRLLRRRRAQPRRGPRARRATRSGATRRRRSSSRARRSRSGCRCRRSWPRSRWRSSGRRSRRPRSSRSSSARSCRSSPGGSPRTSPRSGGCSLGGARDAGARDRADERRLPAARPPLGPARLDDAVRGARPRRLPADDPDRCATPGGVRLARPAPHRARACSSGSPR